MIASSLGYNSYSQFISADRMGQKINIKLSVNYFLLREVNINSRENNHRGKLNQFIKLFLGETTNSQSCRIINKEDIHFFSNSGNDMLNAFSVKPLRVENRALGYTIIYDLKEFNYNLKTGIFRYKGDLSFQPLSGSGRENKRWARNRLSAYYGSKMHFFRALFSDSLKNEKFNLFECKTDTVTKIFIEGKPIPEKDLSLSKNNNYISLYYKSPVWICYTNNHPELSTWVSGYKPYKVNSTIIFSDIVNVYKNGYYNDPYSVTWGGKMADERLADMLPFDFQPGQTVKIETKVESTTSLIEKLLSSQQKTLSSNQVFVHTDRNIYKPGDTIYFQAYIRDRFSGVFESKSASLYAILFNDKRMVTDSSRFRIRNSTSSGWMTVPVTAKPGKYRFVAFTGTMQDYDPLDVFQTDLLIDAENNEPE
jgi:hypothetical protein